MNNDATITVGCLESITCLFWKISEGFVCIILKIPEELKLVSLWVQFKSLYEVVGQKTCMLVFLLGMELKFCGHLSPFYLFPLSSPLLLLSLFSTTYSSLLSLNLFLCFINLLFVLVMFGLWIKHSAVYKFLCALFDLFWL